MQEAAEHDVRQARSAATGGLAAVTISLARVLTRLIPNELEALGLLVPEEETALVTEACQPPITAPTRPRAW